MNWKESILRNILFAVLLAAAGFICTGCCWAMTEKTWERLGSEQASITNRHYEYIPDRGGDRLFRQEADEALRMAVPRRVRCVLEYVQAV